MSEQALRSIECFREKIRKTNPRIWVEFPPNPLYLERKMKVISQKFLFFLLFSVVQIPLSLADVRPTLPALGEDRALTGDKPAADFFAIRRQNATCRADLDRARILFSKARVELMELVAAAPGTALIDSAEKRSEIARRRLLKKTEECGECATREVEMRSVQTAGRKENWYISDGSCQLEGVDTVAAYHRMVDSLLHLRQYPQRYGGFADLLEFVGVDENSGEILPQLDKAEASPFFTFVAIRGPNLGILTAFSYYIKNEFEEKSSGEKRQFVFSFHGTKPPREFRTPLVYQVTASGKKIPAQQIKLPQVMGLWYLNSDGYIRYHTSADFGVSLKFAKELARDILLDTIVQLSERGKK